MTGSSSGESRANLIFGADSVNVGLSGDFGVAGRTAQGPLAARSRFSLEVHQELDAHCPRQGKVYGVVLIPFRRSFRNRMAFRFEMGHAILAMGTAAGGCALRRSRKLGTCGGAALLSLSVQKPCDAA